MIGPLLMTLGAVDYRGTQFSIEHGHTSIGYYAALAALGFLPRERVVESFRRSLDIAGHVLWVPGGTPIGSGRLGVTVPVTAGWSLGLKAAHGQDAFVICHSGDAGWISGQALNGFIAASLHGAPMVLVMHRNGIQLSGTTARVMGKDPRPIVGEPRHRGHRDRLAARSAASCSAPTAQAACARPRGQAVADLSGRRLPKRHRPRLRRSRYGILDEAEHFCGEAQGRDRYGRCRFPDR